MAQSQSNILQPPPYVVSGRCMLQSGDEFVCEIRKLSVTHAAVSADQALEVGDPVVSYIDNVGILNGRVVRTFAGGFILQLDVNERRRPHLAASVEWHQSRAAEVAELRAAPRIVPTIREVEVRFGEAMAVQGLILNISISGAAIQLTRKHRPFVGSLVRLGRSYAVVVRLFDNGIAARFIEPLPSATFDENMTL